MFYSPIYTILLVDIHSSKNKMKKVDGFAVIFDGIQLSQMANNFKYNNTVYGRSLIVTSHVCTCKVLLSLLL